MLELVDLDVQQFGVVQAGQPLDHLFGGQLVVARQWVDGGASGRLVEPAAPRAAVRILGAWTRQPLLDDQSTTIDMAGDPAVLRLPLRARNFSDPETEDGVRCRWVRDRDARLFLPLATPSALAVSIRARALQTIEPQFMELDWNGTTVGRRFGGSGSDSLRNKCRDGRR